MSCCVMLLLAFLVNIEPSIFIEQYELTTKVWNGYYLYKIQMFFENNMTL